MATQLSPAPQKSFEDFDAEGRASLLSEFVYFLSQNKKWWLLPILLVIGGVGLLVLLAGTGAAPFIYTMF
jgi:Family of unknown function (DUF5989)